MENEAPQWARGDLPPLINPVGVFDVPETAVTTEPPFRRTYVWRTVPPWGD